MKKILFSITFIFATISALSAQEINSVFLAMPDNIIFGLEAAQKDLLLASAKDTATVSIDKGTYGEIKRLGISSDFISLQTSDAGTTQIKLLPLINDSKIVCLIKTVCGGACDSQIAFYTTKWVPISQGELFPAKTIEWFIKPGVDRENEDFKNAYASLDMTPMKKTLSPDNTKIIVEYDIKKYLSEEDYKKIQPFLIEEPKVFNWDKTSYK